MTAIYVEITATRGSAPRDAGTVMRVTMEDTDGTIGGGALEHRAITRARDMLRRGQSAFEEALPLGPNLGQCCGGSVTLRYGTAPKPCDPTQSPQPLSQSNLDAPLWVWGAGHVGRAVVHACPPQDPPLTWVDTDATRFPSHIPASVTATPATDMPLLARRAPLHCHHLIFTYSHDIDLALCAALLKRQAASIGLIGSDTKRSRFFKRLRSLGLDPSPIICPIGDKTRGKRPDQIAAGVIDALLNTTAKACT